MPKTLVKSKLSEPLLQLIKMIFDVKRMEKIMVGCEIDLKQMPLGKISEKQVRAAMKTLYNISKLISKNGSIAQLREASNRFYTLIPHSFSVKRPSIIDSIETVNTKAELLESLLNMEIIYGFMNESKVEQINPIDVCYSKLKATIDPVDRNSAEFQRLCQIVRDTHGPTHEHYSIDVMEIFKVQRDAEHDECRGVFQKLDGHRLLWHGSRLMNIVSILSNGLKIAPPEAPHTGLNKSQSSTENT